MKTIGLMNNLTSGEKKKDTNPKDALGVRRFPFSTVPFTVMAEIGLALLEGARKYGRHNYRAIGVRSSVYFDATIRHLSKWWEGEDIDPDSGLSHITKALASLTVLRDAMVMGKLNDDRPVKAPEDWYKDFDRQVEELIRRYPEAVPPYTAIPESS